MIYVIVENGDDYHGTSSVRAFTDKELAKTHAKWLEKEQTPCRDCGNKYYYTVQEIEVD